jgi:mannosyltransferase
LWPDETYSWSVASSSLDAIGQSVLTDQIHVPGYYFLLHYWIRAAGESVFSLRYLSVVAGVLAVAAFLGLVRRLAGPRIALLTGLLAAVHPFLLYYLQEARMYSLLLAVVLLELTLLLRYLDKPSTIRWVAYTAALVASLYVHYTAVVVLPVAALIPALVGRRRWSGHLTNLAALAVAGLVFAPWALAGIGQFNRFAPVTAGTAVPARWLTDYALAINTGEMSFEVRQQLAAGPLCWLFVALLMLLAGVGAVRGQARGVWLSLFLVPLVLTLAIALNGRDFSPRYAITSLLGYIPLLALGIVALPSSALRVMSGGLALAGFLYFDRLYFHDPDFQRQDFRGGVAQVLDSAVPGDALILLNAAPLRPIWRYYAPSTLSPRVLAAPLPADPAAFDSAMRSAIGDADRAELFLWNDFGEDPEHRVRAWLEANAHRVSGWGRGEVAVYGYFTGDPFPTQPPQAGVPLYARFSDRIELLGYRQWSGVNHDGLRLQLVWQRLQPLFRDYRVYVHLVDATGANLAVADHRPAFDTLDLSQWQGSPFLVDEYDLPGDWTRGVRLELGLYDPPSGERLVPAAISLPLPST